MDFTKTARLMVEQGQISARAYREVLDAYEDHEMATRIDKNGEWYTVVDGNLSYDFFQPDPRPQDEPVVAPWGSHELWRPALAPGYPDARRHTVHDYTPPKPSLLKRLANKIRREIED